VLFAPFGLFASCAGMLPPLFRYMAHAGEKGYTFHSGGPTGDYFVDTVLMLLIFLAVAAIGISIAVLLIRRAVRLNAC